MLENTKLRSRGFQPELISGVMDYLWRAIDQDGDVIVILGPVDLCRLNFVHHKAF